MASDRAPDPPADEGFELRVNDHFLIRRDAMNWTLCEQVPGTSREGLPIVAERRTYYAKLHHACEVVVDRSAKNSESTPSAILSAWATAVADIQTAILMASFK